MSAIRIPNQRAVIDRRGLGAAVAEAAAEVKREMEGVAELAVPLAVDVGWGETWYEAKK